MKTFLSNYLKKVTYLASFLGAFAQINAQAQTMVPTTVMNKNFLIERGTGHVCGSCPWITLRCDSVIDEYPAGRGMLVEYHFGPDANPQGGALTTDFRTSFGDSILVGSTLNWPFYLNMMMNRKDRPTYGSTYIFGTNDNQVKAEAAVIVAEASPVNLAMTSSYNSTTRVVTVNVEAYYTGNSATSNNFIQLVLTQDSIISTQYDPISYAPNNHFNDNFSHMNVFRYNINGFTGDPVTTTTAGTLISRTYTYTLPTTFKNVACDPNNCKLTLFIAEDKAASGIQSFTGKVITAIRADLISGSAVSSSIAENSTKNNNDVLVFPNPSSGLFYVNASKLGNHSIEVLDMLGKSIYSYSNVNQSSAVKIDLSAYPKGVYFVKVISENAISTNKILITE